MNPLGKASPRDLKSRSGCAFNWIVGGAMSTNRVRRSRSVQTWLLTLSTSLVLAACGGGGGSSGGNGSGDGTTTYSGTVATLELSHTRPPYEVGHSLTALTLSFSDGQLTGTEDGSNDDWWRTGETGIENKAQVYFLRQHKCDYRQARSFARALPARCSAQHVPIT